MSSGASNRRKSLWASNSILKFFTFDLRTVILPVRAPRMRKRPSVTYQLNQPFSLVHISQHFLRPRRPIPTPTLSASPQKTQTPHCQKIPTHSHAAAPRPSHQQHPQTQTRSPSSSKTVCPTPRSTSQQAHTPHLIPRFCARRPWFRRTEGLCRRLWIPRGRPLGSVLLLYLKVFM
jgi:hypothetical protein